VLDAHGERHEADLVVDAMGRGSVLGRLLGDAVHEEDEGAGFLYYTRFFRGDLPEARSMPLTHVGAFSIITIPADAGVWSVTVVISARDRALRRLRDEEAWTALVRSCPQHAHWLDGEPLTGVLTMGGRVGRRRRIDTRVTGVVSIGDAWAYTNPSLGRGMSLGLVHAALLRAVVREHGADACALVRVFDEVTERELGPWYRSTVAMDRARLAQIDAILAGEEPPPAPDDVRGRVRAALPSAMLRDPEVFRAASEISNCIALPKDVLSRRGLAQRILAAAA
jgi:2-polyprenyl-6-methoxyphenol hydroxylase-like FAD-dependent oxidoreductase